ncbi:hypothetical protein MMC25_000774 [Agyrium rufum]|nr:hypothetical protein [Agyrium rufum]
MRWWAFGAATRNPAPQYIEAIENRLRRAEALLKTVAPEIDLNDPKYDAPLPPRLPRPGNQVVNAPPIKKEPGIAQKASDQDVDAHLESMVKATGSLDLDDQGYWDYHGHSSGLIFIRRMREQFGDLMGETEGRGTPFVENQRIAAHVFDSPRSTGDSPGGDMNQPNLQDLPARGWAKELCDSALIDACALFRFVHIPSFYELFDRIYDSPPEQWGSQENRFLPLLYAVLAVGCLFAKSGNSKLHREGYENAIDQGFVFFKASRNMMDITDCRDLASLQAVIFMIMFLQSSAKLATCYSYIGIALTSAIRLGLHRSILRNFDPIEQETRRRMFWTIRKMDIYVGALLGLPTMLGDDDIDQVFPQEIEDQYLTKQKIIQPPPESCLLMAATNAHTKLVGILSKVMKHIYPIKIIKSEPGKPQTQTYVVSHAQIRELEGDLQEWMENLPMDLRPGGNVTPEIARVQQLLRIAYAHVQMLLYRPFLHYVSQSAHTSRAIDKRSYACAAACVSVSRNIIHITTEMKKSGLLIGAYWFTMYTAFFAILSICFVVLENPDASGADDILKDVMEGRDTLAGLAKRSMAADRCHRTLEGLFGQLPQKLKRGRMDSVSKKKRTHATSPSRQNTATGRSAQPAANMTRQAEATGALPRTTNASKNANTETWRRDSINYDMSGLPAPQNGAFVSTQSQDTYSLGSGETFNTPASSHATLGNPTPETGGGPGAISLHEQQYNQSHQVSNPTQFHVHYPSNMTVGNLPISDMTYMMFNPENPLAYPAQPMITLEDGQFAKQSPEFPNMHDDLYEQNPTASGGGGVIVNGGASSSSSVTAGAGTGGIPYDEVEARFYGPMGLMPQWLIQGTNPADLANWQDTNLTPNNSNGGSAAASLGLAPMQQSSAQAVPGGPAVSVGGGSNNGIGGVNGGWGMRQQQQQQQQQGALRQTQQQQQQQQHHQQHQQQHQQRLQNQHHQQTGPLPNAMGIQGIGQPPLGMGFGDWKNEWVNGNGGGHGYGQ